MIKNKKITIVGLGLMGGSYAKALRRAGYSVVYAVDLDTDVLAQSQCEGVIDEGYTNPSDILPETDILIMSLYPKETIEFLDQYYKYFKDGSLVIDICGVKSMIVNDFPRQMLDKCDFVPTHPMAGREKKGYQMSVTDLFDGCSYIITPLEHNKSESLDIVKQMAYDIGAKKILTCTQSEHDEYISYVSQLPHVLACAYMASSKERPLSEYAAGSFRDVSRVALINEVVWQELFSLNKDFLAEEIQGLIDELDKFRTFIKNDDKKSTVEYMKKAREIKQHYDSID